jgi:hypothetical protein
MGFIWFYMGFIWVLYGFYTGFIWVYSFTMFDYVTFHDVASCVLLKFHPRTCKNLGFE